MSTFYKLQYDVEPILPFIHVGSTEVTTDEHPRHGSNIEAMTKLRAAFIKDGSGTVTAGNASGKSNHFISRVGESASRPPRGPK